MIFQEAPKNNFNFERLPSAKAKQINFQYNLLSDI